jgi:hypothetical protein
MLGFPSLVQPLDNGGQLRGLAFVGDRTHEDRGMVQMRVTVHRPPPLPNVLPKTAIIEPCRITKFIEALFEIEAPRKNPVDVKKEIVQLWLPGLPRIIM